MQRDLRIVFIGLFFVLATLAVATSASADTTAPQIQHTPPTGPFYPGSAIPIQAIVTDESAVPAVRIIYTVPGGSEENVTMAPEGGTYHFSIQTRAGNTGTLRYHLYAVDALGNGGLTPDYTLTIEPRPAEVSLTLATGLATVVIAVVVIAIMAVTIRRRRKTEPPPAGRPPL